MAGESAANRAAGRAEFPGHRRTSTSHTIGVAQLISLLDQLPADSDLSAYSRAVIDDNLLDRPTFTGRNRTLRHLRELYALDPRNDAFRVLRRLWDEDRQAQPQLTGLLAYANDELLRATFPAIASARVGDLVPSDALSNAARPTAGASLNPASLARLGRNAAASWTQTGHLSGRSHKRRAVIAPRPVAVAYALYLGQLAGLRGSYLLDSPWLDWFTAPEALLETAQSEAIRLGYVDLRRAGGMVEVGFTVFEGGTHS